MEENRHIIWQHFSKRTLALVGILLLITGGLLYLAIREEQPTHNRTMVSSPTPFPAHAVLSLIPETSSASAFQTIDIVIDSHENKVTGVQVNLAYDPQILSNVVVKAGTYFPHAISLLNNVDKTNGRISYVLAIGPNDTQATGSGVVATISYTLLPTAKASTILSFLPKTEVTQQGILESVLKSSSDVTISIPPTLQISPTASAAY